MVFELKKKERRRRKKDYKIKISCLFFSAFVQGSITLGHFYNSTTKDFCVLSHFAVVNLTHLYIESTTEFYNTLLVLIQNTEF